MPEATFGRISKRFFAAASEAMRCVVIDHYRRKHCLKRGENNIQSLIDVGAIAGDCDQIDLLALNEALDHFE